MIASGLVCDYITQFGLNDQLPSPLIDALKIRHFSSRNYIFRQNEPLEHLYLLVNGRLRVDNFLADGQQAVFSFMEPLSIIGELEILDNVPAFSNVIATTDSTLLSIPAALVRNFGSKNPLFLKFVIHQMNQKLMRTALINAPANTPLEQRLCRYLEHRFSLEGAEYKLESRIAIASMLRTSVRHLNRTLNNLRELGVIDLKYQSITINDPKELVERMGEVIS